MFLKKLENKLWNKPYCNDLHFFMFAVALLFLSMKYNFFFVLLIPYMIFILKKTRYFVPIFLLLMVTFCSYELQKYKLNDLSDGVYEDRFRVIETNDKSVVLKGNTKIVVFNKENNLKAGDIIHAKIKISSLDLPSYATDFNQKEYYFSKKITNKGKILEYEKVGEYWNIARIKDKVLRIYETKLGSKTFRYVKTIFFGITDLDTSVKKSYSSLYISHLLAISGMHIMLYYSILLWFFQKFLKVRGEKITLFLLGIYLIFLGCKISAIRAYLFLILHYLNQKGTIKYTKLDILSLSFLWIGICFPLQVYQMGFMLSFIVSFVLVFMEDYNTGKCKVSKIWMNSILCTLSILPFLINQMNEIHILGLFLACPLTLFLSKVLLPFILFIMMFPYYSYEYVFKSLDELLSILANVSIPIYFPSFSIIFLILYYLIFLIYLVLLAKKKNKVISQFVLIGFFVLIYLIRLVNPFYRVTFIDVGQGDSILIELPRNEGVILVDSYNDNLNFLKSIGVKRIDYLILTHSDLDHIGSVKEVVESINVKNVVYSVYEDAEIFDDLICPTIRVKSGDKIEVSSFSLQILGPIQKHNSKNANSIVLSFEINSTTFLLTGDMTVEEERDLIDKYGIKLKSDFLKVGHHGSSSSTSEEFLERVSPKYSIISVGKNNIYGLPDEIVLQRLKKYSNILMTKDTGNIEVYLWKTCHIKPYRT